MNEDYTVKVGDTIFQLICEVILYPSVQEVFNIYATERSENGFGSSGR